MSQHSLRKSALLFAFYALISGCTAVYANAYADAYACSDATVTSFAHELSGSKQETEEKIEIRKEWKGSRCGYVEPSQSVISTEGQWTKTWDKMFHHLLSKPELPKIDFDSEMILAAFMGERRTGGYVIRIKRIIKTDKDIVAYIEEKEPDPESLRTQALTQPYHVVVIKKYSLPVRFQQL